MLPRAADLWQRLQVSTVWRLAQIPVDCGVLGRGYRPSIARCADHLHGFEWHAVHCAFGAAAGHGFLMATKAPTWLHACTTKLS